MRTLVCASGLQKKIISKVQRSEIEKNSTCSKNKSFNLLSLFSILTYGEDKSTHEYRSCKAISDSAVKENCRKLNRINKKLDYIIKRLKFNDGSGEYNYREVEYTCKGIVHHSGRLAFEGHGLSVNEARRNLQKKLQPGMVKSKLFTTIN